MEILIKLFGLLLGSILVGLILGAIESVILYILARLFSIRLRPKELLAVSVAINMIIYIIMFILFPPYIGSMPVPYGYKSPIVNPGTFIPIALSVIGAYYFSKPKVPITWKDIAIVLITIGISFAIISQWLH